MENVDKIYQDMDEYDEYLQEKADDDYNVAMTLQPQRELEEQDTMDELFPKS